MPTGFETAFKAGCSDELNLMYKSLTITQNPGLGAYNGDNWSLPGRIIMWGQYWHHDITDPGVVSASYAGTASFNWAPYVSNPPNTTLPTATYQNNNLTQTWILDITTDKSADFDGLLDSTIIPAGIISGPQIESSITSVINKAVTIIESEIGVNTFDVFSCHSSCHASCHRDGHMPGGTY